MSEALLEQARRLPVDEQIALAEALWQGVAEHGLNAAQAEELDRRLAEHGSQPDDVVAWDEVRTDALKRCAA